MQYIVLYDTEYLQIVVFICELIIIICMVYSSGGKGQRKAKKNNKRIHAIHGAHSVLFSDYVMDHSVFGLSEGEAENDNLTV